MTIFARNPDTGKARGPIRRRRTTRGTTTASTRTCWSILNINGQTRKVLVNFDRNGFSYVLDRKTGELLLADPFVHVNWAKGIDLKTGKPIEIPRSAPPRPRTPRTSARRRWAARTSSRCRTRRAPGSSTCPPTTCAWTTRASR